MSTPTRNDGPDWVREALAVTRDEIARFLATAVGFCLRPARFSAAWLAGEAKALNPLGFLATALTISSAVGLLHPGSSDDGGVWAHLAAATIPYAYYVFLGVLCHPLLRVAGSTRSLRTSVAIALFAGGGPGLVVTLGGDLADALRLAIFGHYRGGLFVGVPPWAVLLFGLLSGGTFAYFLVTLALGLAGLHGVRRRQAALVLLAVVLISGLFMGALHRVARFNLAAPHVVITMSGWLPVPDLWF